LTSVEHQAIIERIGSVDVGLVTSKGGAGMFGSLFWKAWLELALNAHAFSANEVCEL